MENAEVVDDGADSDTTIILETSDEEMDVEVDREYLTPDLLPVEPQNVELQPNIIQQEESGASVPVVQNVLSRNSSPRSLITNRESPIMWMAPVLHRIDSFMVNTVSTENVIQEDERSRSPISIIAATEEISQNSVDIKVPDDEPSVSNNGQLLQQEDDGMTCPICFDSWTNLGEHRVCALKCGHLFGLSCIIRWISTLKNRNCPTCKKKSTKNDIRHIYARKLVAMDSTELDEMKCKLSQVTEEKNRICIELTKAVCRERLIEKEFRELKDSVKFLNSALDMQNYNTASKSDGSAVRIYKEKSLELCKEKGCRVLSYYDRNNLIVASLQSPNALFPGFGVRKIDILTFKPTSYIPLHIKSIRDVRFHSSKPWLLSVSLDQTFKIIDTISNSTIQHQNKNNLPLWSCCWDTNDDNAFFVGEQQGSIMKFDIRQMNQAADTYSVPGDNSPVVSIATINAGLNSPLEGGGIISCKLNSLWVFNNKSSSECSRHFLPIDPPFIYMTYDNTTPQMLLSTRPTSSFPYTRHHICKLGLNDLNSVTVNVSHCFKGSTISKLLSRSCFLSYKSNCYAAAYQESDKMVYLWNTETAERISTPAYNNVLDLCSVSNSHSTYLLSLTESKLDFYKFQ